MPSGLRTYSHLASKRRVPSEYELVTSRLLYHPQRGFEVAVPLADWYRRFQQGSPLRCSDWEAFEDPRQTTYASYVALQSKQEAHVDGILASIDARGYDTGLPEPALAFLAEAVAPLRFAFHGLQMLAAYVGQMAPSGRIAVAALFQAADEMRRLQRVAYRLGQLRVAHGRFARVAEDSRTRWQEEAAWQPLRRLIERLLLVYDWGEALVALNLCAKPLLDELIMVSVPGAARPLGDYLLSEIYFSLAEDCRWHRAWTSALVGLALRDSPPNRTPINAWIDAWLPPVREAAAAFSRLLGKTGDDALATAEARASELRALVLFNADVPPREPAAAPRNGHHHNRESER
jgi:toluene monooxygenase system protein E